MGMLRNLALIAGSVGVIGAMRNKARQQQADQKLWAQATDPVTPAQPQQPTPPPQTPPAS